MSALNFLQHRLSGIVTTTDNGGSTGRIRDNHGGIAWGDLRNCLNQIIVKPSPASELFEYRFSGQGELAGHNLGNLMLRALEDLDIRPLTALDLIRKLLRVKSAIIPMSEEPVHLGAFLHDGSTIVGEVGIDALKEVPTRLFLVPQVDTVDEAVKAIQLANVILLGPGSFLTSIMPPLLISRVAHALNKSSARKIYIDNLGVEHSPAANLSLSERIEWLKKAMLGISVDAIITSRKADYKDVAPEIVITARNLRDGDISYRHNRLLLCHAINDTLHYLTLNR